MPSLGASTLTRINKFNAYLMSASKVERSAKGNDKDEQRR